MRVALPIFSVLALLLTGSSSALPYAPLEYNQARQLNRTVFIPSSDNRIFYTGRWDVDHSSWWASSGITLHVSGALDSFAVHLGNRTTSPSVTVGLSVDYAPFVSMNLTEGINQLPIRVKDDGSHVLRVNVEGWMKNRMHLEGVEFNQGVELLQYKPSPLVFEFIGDSLLSGQYTEQTGLTSWGFIVGETFKAEHNSIAQPGACLNGGCWGNPHGMSFQYWMTEDSGFSYEPGRANITTRWDFKKQLAPTHVVVQLGANDFGFWNTKAASFSEAYANFLRSLRLIYPTQPIIVPDWWGWPSSNSSTNDPIYPGVAQQVVKWRNQDGDDKVWYVPTDGWVTYADVNPGNFHPSTSGCKKIASLFSGYIQDNFKIQPEETWAISTGK